MLHVNSHLQLATRHLILVHLNQILKEDFGVRLKLIDLVFMLKETGVIVQMDVLELGAYVVSLNKKNHTSKMQDLGSSLITEDMLQNFLHLYKKKTQVVFFDFQIEQLLFFPYEFPGLCQNRPRSSFKKLL